jgi:hypothetical protein
MRIRILAVLSALLAAGCFFGGDNETSTVPDPVKPDSTAKAKLIVPGMYVGDYAWIDSGKHGLESEFILDTNGTYRLFWISENEAVYDQRGNWNQRDSSFYFSKSQETWVAGGVFSNFESIEDDTNSVRSVTDTSFIRREWTPLRQKPYWITYHKRVYPKLTDGSYLLEKIDSSMILDSVPVLLAIKISFTGHDFFYSYSEKAVEKFQAKATFYQVGSFLATEDNQQRELDSTNTFPETWTKYSGSILKRLQSVSDTAFSMWNPPAFLQPAGTWESYSKNLVKQ